MGGELINKRLLKSRMALRGVNVTDLARAMGWSRTTADRKVNGRTAFKAPEIQRCREVLDLDVETANGIFFAEEMS